MRQVFAAGTGSVWSGRGRAARVILWIAAVLSCFVAPRMPGAFAQGENSREYAIKAAFLYNFVKFVDWPSQALPEASPTITIGILGRNPFGAALGTISGKTVKGKTLVVRQFSSVQDVERCHVLFISESEKPRLRQILNALGGSSILTVGETEGFARSGGIINLTTRSNKVRFEINPQAAERARLRISSQLLKLATVVRA